jgi:hypothetical protein
VLEVSSPVSLVEERSLLQEATAKLREYWEVDLEVLGNDWSGAGMRVQTLLLVCLLLCKKLCSLTPDRTLAIFSNRFWQL